MHMKRIVSLLLTVAILFTSVVTVSGLGGPAMAAETPQDILDAMRQEVAEHHTAESAPTPQFAADEVVELIVTLHSAAAVELSREQAASEIAQDDQVMGQVERAREACIQQILAIDPQAEITNRYGMLLSGFSVMTRYGNKDEIEALPQVESVVVANRYERSVTTLKDTLGVNAVAQNPGYGYTGEGIVVAVVDSGIDHKHPDMKLTAEGALTKEEVDALRTQLKGKGSYYTEKVPFAYNYADGSATDVIDTNKSDPAYNHGMHVAGIIGANGNDFKGIAPECQLLNMKIFSNTVNGSASEADIIAAIEDAVTLGADVINLSIGLSAGFNNPGDKMQEAIKKARNAGVVVVGASGNAGTSNYHKDPSAPNADKLDALVDIGTLSEPGLAADAIQVASMDNATRMVGAMTATISGTNTDIPYILSDFNITTLTGTYDVVDCGLARPEDVAGLDLTGKVALIQRGEIEFQEKKLNVQYKGAVAAIIYNHDGDNTFLDFIATSDEVRIPTIFLRGPDGVTLRNACKNGLKVSFPNKSMAVPQAGGISYFSSWGPTPDLTFKPDITAVGGYVWSTIGNEGPDNLYQTMSGTSMACPNVSGLAALMLQHMEEKNIDAADPTDYIKTTLMNTAHPLTDNSEAVSPRAQGAGMAYLPDALANQVTVNCEGDPYIELKAFTDVQEVEITLTNHGSAEMTYTPYAEGSGADGVTFSTNTVIVPAGKSVTLTATIAAGGAENTFVEGFIRFRSADKTAPEIGLPFMGFYGDWSALQILDDPMYEESSVFGKTGLYTLIGSTGAHQVLADGRFPQYYAISPEDPQSNTNAMAKISFLRNARNVSVEVLDSENTVLKILDHQDYVRKELPLEDAQLAKAYTNWAWYGRVYDKTSGEQVPVDEGQYYFRIQAQADYADAQAQTLVLPLKVDKTAPTVAIHTAFTQSNTCTVEIEARDLGVVDGGIQNFIFMVGDTPYRDENGNAVITLTPDANGKYHMELPIPADGKIHDVTVGVTDYARNMGAATSKVVNTSGSKLTVDVGSGPHLPGKAVPLTFRWADGFDASQVAEYQIFLEDLTRKVGSTKELTFSMDELLPVGTYTIIVKAVGQNGSTVDINYVEITVGGDAFGDSLVVEHTGTDTALTGGKPFTAEIQAANLGAATERVALILCLYDQNGRMVDAAAVERELASSAMEHLSCTITVPASGVYTAKIMVWDGLDTMESLLPMKSVTMAG